MISLGIELYPKPRTAHIDIRTRYHTTSSLRTHQRMTQVFDKVDCKVMFSKNVLSVDSSILDVQIDNHCEASLHPVLMWQPQDDRKKRIAPDAIVFPFLQFAGIRETRRGPPSSSVFKYLTGRMMPIILEVDSATLELFVIDFLSSLHIVSADERKAKAKPSKWIEAYNAGLVSPLNMHRVVSIYESLRYCQQSKSLFENIVFHPIKVFLTFASISLPRGREQDTVSSMWLDILGSFATVDLLQIRLKSFIVSHAVESVDTLSRRLQAKVVHDIRSQLAQIAGSLTVLGSPAGLVRNIGGGVQVLKYL